LKKLETIPRPYFDFTVQTWVGHVLTLLKEKAIDIEAHECGFCHYVQRVTPKEDILSCEPCPAYRICRKDPGYWELFVALHSKRTYGECLEIALRILEWLHDFEAAGKVTKAVAGDTDSAYYPVR